MSTIMWFRRDLRLGDNPAMNAALDADRAGRNIGVLPVFIIDPLLWDSAGEVRRAYLLQSLNSLDDSLKGSLHIRLGDPRVLIPELARSINAASVHISEDFGPYGRRRDAEVDRLLGAVPLVRTGSPYAISPGRVTKSDGQPYRVFTPFYRAWLEHGWRLPAQTIEQDFIGIDGSQSLPSIPPLREGFPLPPAGEAAAWEQWKWFQEHELARYSSQRNRPDLAATSGMSHHLRWGEIHPRSMLSALSPADEVFRKELCWREFYADVLFHSPDSARLSLDQRFDAMRWAEGEQAEFAFEQWRLGATGYPLVDAGMRQLLSEGWMHNRVRMVTASFLVKDLHLPWQRGASWFMQQLRDADLASNSHGWQWVAGCGTDASPFYRVFNPVLQGVKFDPTGDYVRRYVPELGHLEGSRAHEPWKHADGYAGGYSPRLVDHAAERLVALDDYALIRQPSQR
ncbi:MAG: deoxyribodipyrimidine photo-lyase [Actinomycetota bacterium]|nr:deoxyribodipyrimidine photo-lyase [Actinomycetota bacterium]